MNWYREAQFGHPAYHHNQKHFDSFLRDQCRDDILMALSGGEATNKQGIWRRLDAFMPEKWRNWQVSTVVDDLEKSGVMAKRTIQNVGTAYYIKQVK